MQNDEDDEDAENQESGIDNPAAKDTQKDESSNVDSSKEPLRSLKSPTLPPPTHLPPLGGSGSKVGENGDNTKHVEETEDEGCKLMTSEQPNANLYTLSQSSSL